ncbi:MAG: hypothetical protein EP343_10690 [Deltaproteobacteria bacterium]|nr:MAG: hypothetical protein EP343_10690 [Deltaproteobacteria bacterium]
MAASPPFQGLIFLTLFGSRAYGTSTPASDWDVRGVGIGPLTSYFGTRPWTQTQDDSQAIQEHVFQQFPEAKEAGDLDCEIHNISKFVKLASDANPNIFDVLFADPNDWLFHTPVWEQLYNNRKLFLTMRVRHTYTGYAMSQLKRIKTHRNWLLHPPSHKPTRSEFGLPEVRSLVPRDIQDLANSMIVKKQQEWQLDTYMELLPDDEREDFREALLQHFEMVHGRTYDPNQSHEREQAAVQLGMPADLYKRLEAERGYKQAAHQWKQYQTWLAHRNEERAALEKSYGYDCKHAMHLVRLLFSVEEILTTGDLSVRHPHAELLRDVRSGAWSYDELMDWATQQEAKIHELSKSKPLPRSPDRDAIDQLVTDMILTHHDSSSS